MTVSSPAEIQTLIEAEFDRRRWEYSAGLGLALGAEIERSGIIDAASLARLVPGEFLHRAGTDRTEVQAAIAVAIGGRTLSIPVAPTVLQFTDNRRYEVRLARGAQINNSNVNIGEGQQINVNASAPPEQLLAAVEALVLAGLDGVWNSAAATALAKVIGERDDVTLEDIRELTVRTVQAQAPSRGRIKSFLDDLTANALGGALGTGLASGLGQALAFFTS